MTFNITKASAEALGLNAEGYNGVYDGKSHAASASATVTDETTFEYKVGDGDWSATAPSIKDVGEQKVSVRATNPNYDVAFAEATLKVTPAKVTITTGSGSKAYDGTALTNSEASITGLVSGEKATVSANGSQTEVGSSKNTYTISWTSAKASNYEITENLGTLTVTEANNPDDDDDNPGGGGNPDGGGNRGGGNVAPVTPDDDGTIIPDEPVPEGEPEPEIIPDEPTPMALTWAVANLVLAILTALGAVIALFRKKEEDDDNEDDEDDNRNKKMLAAKIAGALAGVAAPITFFLTENMSDLPVLFDKWTPLMVGIMAVQVVAAVLNKNASKVDDEDGAEEAAN